MAGGTRIPVLVGQDRGRVFIRPVGSCTLLICGLINDCLEKLGRPATTDVYFDLSEVDAIDSTFTGLLVSLAKVGDDRSGPATHLLNPAPPVVEALERMHVLSLFDRCTSVPRVPTRWHELTGEAADRDKLAELVIAAHEQLIEADPRNTEVFGPVVEGLRAERRRTIDPGQGDSDWV